MRYPLYGNWKIRLSFFLGIIKGFVSLNKGFFFNVQLKMII